MALLPIVHHPAYVAAMPAGHRFPMRKFGRLVEILRARGLLSDANWFQAEPAPRAWIELVHDPAWVTAVIEQRASPAQIRELGLPITPEVGLRSRAASAGTVLAARLALEHGLACNTAGGSHHAYPDRGTGFCTFNDVAVAARLLLSEGSVRRVLVFDLDVHQGDGTAAIFRHDPAVRTVSVHARSNFPVRKQQSDLDVALDDGTGDESYLATVQDLLGPELTRRPDLVIYNAGVDPHAGDRLGRLMLTDDGLHRRERMVIRACRDAGIPLACVIGGGYDQDIDALAARHAILFEEAAASLRP